MLDVKVFLCLLMLGSFCSCANEETDKRKVLKHVVSFQFKEEVSAAQKAEAIQRFRTLKDSIPEIQTFEGGENISAAGLSKGFSHCFVLTFEHEAARDIYLPHPAHQRVVEANKPLFSDLMVLDYWGEE